MDYRLVLQNEIYPVLSGIVDTAFPEFEFRERGNKWVSTNTLHLSGIDGQHGKGKVTISKNKPYVIGDFREGTKEVINYLVESGFHPQVSDFKTAVEYLASVTNTTLEDSNISTNWQPRKFIKKEPIKQEIIHLPIKVFKASLKDYNSNSFAQYLSSLFGAEKAKELIERFYIGTSKYWSGATVFWLIDKHKNIAGGQVILFDENGSTVKQPFRHNNWVHKAMIKSHEASKKNIPEWLKKYDQMEGNKYSCLFGLPQIKKEPLKPVAIVEAAKTAIIATAYFPQFNWLAVGSLSYFNKSRLSSLKGKSITLFPDKGGFELWSKKANELKEFANISVSDLLERKGKDKTDLADYLIKYDWRNFQDEPEQPVIEDNKIEMLPEQEIKVPGPEVNPLFPSSDGWELEQETRWTEADEKLFTPKAQKPSKEESTKWQETVKRLTSFFESAELPDTIQLKSGALVTNVEQFVKSHLRIAKNNQNKPVFSPYLERLEQLEQLLTKK